ncbi:MAG TPA: GTPase [Anaerolineales bacterium]|nr:GTPase [Anaerolineales bacterium]
MDGSGGRVKQPESWTDPVRRRWESLPAERRRDLNRIFGLLPGSFRRWRGLLEAGLTHVRLTAGDRRRVAILGPPNAGKSTLYNHLILDKKDQAQVGPQPGTTRVAQEGDVGLFAVVDTPGADPSTEAPLSEAEGLRAGPEMGDALGRALDAARRADVLVILFDATRPLGVPERDLFQQLAGFGKPWVVALNKMDAVAGDRARTHGKAAQVLGLSTEDVVPVSARTGGGLERLLTEIARREPEIVAALGEALPAYRATLAKAAIRRAASTAAAIALTPLPMLDFIPLMGVQAALVLALARIYGYRITLARARELMVTFGIGLMARSLFYELIKFGGPPGWLVSAGVAAGATTALGYGAASWFDRGERLSRERLQGISRSVGETFVAHLRGRRRPGRGEIEREVELILEDTPPPEA